MICNQGLCASGENTTSSAQIHHLHFNSVLPAALLFSINAACFAKTQKAHYKHRVGGDGRGP
jgi:hypothetical protein